MNNEGPQNIPQKSRKPTRDAEGSIIKKVEERRTSGNKTRKETVFYARVRYTDNDGRKREKKRRAESYNDAVIKRRELQNEIQDELAEDLEKKEKPKTFFELLDYYEQKYVKEAQYIDGNKVSGQRDPLRNPKRMIRKYKEFFGDVELSEINYFLLSKFKEHLETTSYKIKKTEIRQLSKEEIKKLLKENPKTRRRTEKIYIEETRDYKPATVHRYLSRLRRIFSVGVQIQWMPQNPFKHGDALISPAIEETRTRVCSFEEENRLLAVCSEPREHLRDIIICAIDTFLRESELFGLTGADIDFNNGYVKVAKTNSKTGKERQVPMTERVRRIFKRILREFPERQNSRIFGIKSARNSWVKALEKAGINGLRFHDLRATGITRTLDSGIPSPIVMKFSGHEKFETFQKYIRSDVQMIKNAGELMSRFHKTKSKKKKETKSEEKK
jgi:integrase